MSRFPPRAMMNVVVAGLALLACNRLALAAGEQAGPDSLGHIVIWMDQAKPSVVRQAIAHGGATAAMAVGTYIMQRAQGTLATYMEDTSVNFATAMGTAATALIPAVNQAYVNAHVQTNLPYINDYNGAKRDIIAGVVAGTVRGTLVLALQEAQNYTTTQAGKYVVGISNAAILLMPDAARFYGQEEIKGFLINKLGVSAARAPYAAFAAAQVIGVGIGTPASMGAYWGVAQYFVDGPSAAGAACNCSAGSFASNTTNRRYLLNEVSLDAAVVNKIDAFCGNSDVTDQFYCTQGKMNGMSDPTKYYSDLALLKAYEDNPTFTNPNPKHVPAFLPVPTDSYPGDGAVYGLADFPMKEAVAAIHKEMVAPCTYSEVYVGSASRYSQTLRCPFTPKTYDISFTLNPLAKDANGNILVTQKMYERKGKTAFATSTFLINDADVAKWNNL